MAGRYAQRMMILSILLIGAALLAVAWFSRHKWLQRTALPVLSAEQAALATRLQGHVTMLGQSIGERNLWHHAELDAAADYIEAQFRAAGLRVERQEYLAEGKRVGNLVAEIPGAEYPEQILLVGAHYDSVLGSPGANDNGSGVAALLELARQLADSRPKRTLHLVAFVNEEPPFFKSVDMGSRIYAEQARGKRDKIVGMICLETIGYYIQEPGSQNFPFLPMVIYYPDEGNFIAFVTNLSSRRLLKKSLAEFRKQSDFPAEGLVAPGWLPGVDWSDHWSFWRVGYPAIMITDTAPYRYPYYHSWEDTPDKLSYPEFAQVVEGVVGMVRGLTN
ncbi:MAG: M20/M25/M40 family metallo-hydrolase [Desulfuromonadaceae bacterium]|nr:M20/M25/M40 family metallo-hydrolase [Desulfuromonadaceae bacterium]